MRGTHVVTSLSLAASLVSCGGADPPTDRSPASSLPSVYLPRAHSHNDYVRERPLLDAVERGFASVEVDVFLIDGELYVAHEWEEVRPSATLSRLYLDPLRELVRRNGGWIYEPSVPSLQLLIDVKTPADETYRALDRTLGRYGNVFTRWSPEGVTRGPVSAVLSGNRAVGLFRADTVRWVALDGRLDDDRSGMSREAMPLVSVDWAEVGPAAPNGELDGVRELVERVHDEGRKIRFWGTPDREAMWDSLTSLGVDYIGTDDSASLQRFLMRE